MNSKVETPASEPGPKLADHYYRHLCDHAGVAMISTDRDLIIRTWNATAARMFGASSAGMIGTPIVSVMPTESRQEGERLIQQAVDEGSITNYHFDHRDSQGNARTLIVTFSPVIDDQTRIIGALACIRDITLRIRLETELARRSKMAALGEMAGALAHHLNNMLGGAVTSVDFALSTDVPSLQTRVLKQTSDALGRASKLLNSLLAFAEGDQRTQDQCNLVEVIIEVADYIESEMSSENIKLALKLDPNTLVTVPRAQFVTVIENILHNAVDAMPNGGTATVETSTQDGVAKLDITDTGCGMDEASAERVFEPFYGTKSRGADFEHHPGLGMAVAHGILSVLGHQISVSSAVGAGTTVSIRFNANSTKQPHPAND